MSHCAEHFGGGASAWPPSLPILVRRWRPLHQEVASKPMEPSEPTKLSTPSLEAITAAVLAVQQQWGIKKTWELLPALRSAGLTDPARTADADIADVTRRLVAAGYARGKLTSLFARRIMDLMVAARDGELDAFERYMARGDKDTAVAVLVAVKGIGPVVADTVWMLRGAGRRE